MTDDLLRFSDAPGDFLNSLTWLCLSAGSAIMEIYRGDDFSVSHKSDHSPVTRADLVSDRIIIEGLSGLYPDIPIISEESAIPEIGLGDGLFFLVDPLDGTKEFIKRNGEFTINIGLIYDRAPVAGIIYAPALGRIFRGFKDFGGWESRLGGLASETNGFEEHCGLFWRRLFPGPVTSVKDNPVIIASHSRRALPDYFSFSGDLVDTSRAHIVNMGSSLKFCLLANGEADYYPRLHRTMEWDTAAGHAILRCCGGEVLTSEGNAFLYGKVGDCYANPSFIARRWC